MLVADQVDAGHVHAHAVRRLDAVRLAVEVLGRGDHAAREHAVGDDAAVRRRRRRGTPRARGPAAARRGRSVCQLGVVDHPRDDVERERPLLAAEVEGDALVEVGAGERVDAGPQFLRAAALDRLVQQPVGRARRPVRGRSSRPTPRRAGSRRTGRPSSASYGGRVSELCMESGQERLCRRRPRRRRGRRARSGRPVGRRRRGSSRRTVRAVELAGRDHDAGAARRDRARPPTHRRPAPEPTGRRRRRAAGRRSRAARAVDERWHAGAGSARAAPRRARRRRARPRRRPAPGRAASARRACAPRAGSARARRRRRRSRCARRRSCPAWTASAPRARPRCPYAGWSSVRPSR